MDSSGIIPDRRLGVDLGGTKMHAVVIDRRGKVLGSARRPTKAEAGYRTVLERIVETVREAAADAGVPLRALRAIGVGMPGPIDLQRGHVVVAPNLGWKDKPVAVDLGALLRRPVALGNDVNCGGLGEAVYGAAKGTRSAVAAFVGTGLGGALISAGQIVNGAHGFGGEIGHLQAPFGAARCGCGRRGCLETVASKTGIARLIREFAADGMRCKLEIGKDGKVRSSELLRAWKDGCPATRKAIKQAARGLAWGLAVAAGVFDPEVFVLGGGVIEALGGVLVPEVREQLGGYSFLYRQRRPDVRRAELGDDAVAVGAAVASAGAVRR